MLSITDPTTLRFQGYEDRADDLKRVLTYQDRSVDFQLKKFRRASVFWKEKLGDEGFTERLNELKEQRERCLLQEDRDGAYTYSGLAGFLSERFKDGVTSHVVYPEGKPIPWFRTPPDLRPYQTQAKVNLLARRHAAVSMGTGLGKSFIIMHVLRELGLKAVVMVPFTNIAEQLYDDFRQFLGDRYVGAYFDGKKKFDKLITVATAGSLTRVEPGTPAHAALSQAQVFVADESHFTPADTLFKVCIGLCKDAPYRFFFSGTQIRNDGAELLLNAIIGPIVYSMSVREGVDQGWLAKPSFKVYGVESHASFYSDDAMKMTRVHYYQNPMVNKLAATLANASVLKKDYPTLILVDEVEQFSALLPYLRVPVQFAHGPLTKTVKKGRKTIKGNIESVPEAHRESHPRELVQEFNAGKFPLLVGTSCVNTGTDFKVPKHIINLQGGRSEITLRQSVGRGTRIHRDSGKTEFIFSDIDVTNVDMMHRHAMDRMSVYGEIYDQVEYMDLSGRS
jgi:superfamily II DNA or RNA helicase